MGDEGESGWRRAERRAETAEEEALRVLPRPALLGHSAFVEQSNGHMCERSSSPHMFFPPATLAGAVLAQAIEGVER